MAIKRETGIGAGLGPLQQDVLDFVLDHPGCTVRDCLDALSSSLGKDYAYTTIQTVMDTLHRKRLVARRRNKNAFHYTARESRAGMLAQAMRDLAARFLAAPQPVASSLVDALEESDPAELQALIDELRERGHIK